MIGSSFFSQASETMRAFLWSMAILGWQAYLAEVAFG